MNQNELEHQLILTQNALRGIIEIGKRDTTNPKYDSYFEEAKRVLQKANE